MDFPQDITSANGIIQGYLITSGAALPDFTRQRLIEATAAPSPVDRIVNTAEILFASKDSLDNPAREVCAKLAFFATTNSWHGLTTDNRGGRIVQAMQRDMGEEAPEGMPWPDAETDPTPKAEFVEPAPTEAPE